MSDRKHSVSVPRPTLPAARLPDAMLTRTLPFKIVQNTGLTIILYEEFNNWRQVFTDGRSLPDDPHPNGSDTRRQWYGQTFFVDTSGFNDKFGSMLEVLRTPSAAPPPSDFSEPTSYMEVEFTSNDPKAFTRVWSATVRLNLLPDTDLLEHHCDNEKWVSKSRE